MSRIKRFLVALAVGIVFGGLAPLWCVNLSECVYVAIPPVALAMYLTGAADLRSTLQSRLRPGLAIAVGLLLLGIVIASAFFGARAVLSWRVWLEVGMALYYLSAVILVLGTTRRLLLAGGRALPARWQKAPGVRIIVCEALPLALFIFLAVPYALALANVHRFKLPNVADPRRVLGREYVEVAFASADGVRLHGWWIPARARADRTLVFCHGVAGNRMLFLPYVEVGDWLDANVLLFDLRGCGESGGHTTTLGCKEKHDVLAAIAWARRERPAQARWVIGMGSSLGAAALAQAAAEAEPPLAAVILDTSFTSTRDMTHSAIAAFPPPCHPWLLSLGLPLADLHAGCPMLAVSPEASIDRLRAPVLFLHSRGDPVIPLAHTIRLHERAAEPKALHVFELNGHCDGFFARRDEYRGAIDAFMRSSHLGTDSPTKK